MLRARADSNRRMPSADVVRSALLAHSVVLDSWRLNLRLPAQHWLARCGRFVEARDSRRVRGSFYQFRVFLDLLGNGPHSFEEKVEFLLRLAFSRLDHHCPGNDQRKCCRVRVESV